MASAPQANLPLFYKDLMPLNSRDHGKSSSRSADKAPWITAQHAIPLTVDEFPQAQRHFPIVFSSGNSPVPLALMGLNEGINTYFDDSGAAVEDFYVPAYVRRYPFLLAKLDSSSDNMSLCFDPSSDLVGEFKDGIALFDKEGQPSEHTQGILQFCQRFEEAGQRTALFIEELKKHELLMEGEVAIQRGDAGKDAQPYVYRGFSMVNQEKLRDIRGDVLRTWNQNGMLALIYAHLMSLDLMRVIFARQTAQGKGPGATQAAEEQPAPKGAKTKK
jgi:hypothetical protein